VEHTEYFASGNDLAVFVVSAELAAFGMLCIDNMQRDVPVSYNQSKHVLLCFMFIILVGIFRLLVASSTVETSTMISSARRPQYELKADVGYA